MAIEPTTRSEISPTRRRLFRLLAIGLGLSSVGLLELGLRLAGMERWHEPPTPLVEFSQIQPLFVLNESGDRYTIPQNRRAFFQPDSFTAQKPDGQFRIFCFGGSTVQGRPYSIETSFTTWLELNLQAAEPERDWEVVNCGGVSYASYRLVPILREVLQYEPDLLIVYTGHNEFLEARTYSQIKRRPLWLRRLQSGVADLRIARLMYACFPKHQAEKVDLPAEVDALLDYEGGMAEYHRDDTWRDGVIYEYEQNLRLMIEIARGANVPLILANPVSNIRDTPPFKVEPPAEFTDEELADFQQLWQAAKDRAWDDLAVKRKAVEQVLNMDDRHAEAHFLLAKVFEAEGNYSQAEKAYLRAKDEDICPLRMLESMHTVLRRVAANTDTTMLDIRGQFESLAEHGLPGDEELIDHVHPRIEGHQQIADTFFEELRRRKIVKLQSGWKQRRASLYRDNYASLPVSYFPESVERLRGLKRWAAGRATRLKFPPQE